TLRFDYKQLEDGTTINPGTPFKLAKDDWLIDHRPYSSVDLEADPGEKTPERDELDYALLRVEGAPGKRPLAPDTAEREAPARGDRNIAPVYNQGIPFARVVELLGERGHANALGAQN